MSYPLDQSANGSGFKTQGVGGENVPSHRLVYLADNGTWYQADASTDSTMPASAITCGGLLRNQQGELLLFGLISLNEWRWASRKLLYASKTPGFLTQTRPDVIGDQVQVVGLALTETLILFNPNYVIVEVQ